ncbi:hypothetical protein BDZ94DRAFT_1170722 [Collybia nuda]|uniref:BZIP domain-containing protein n=1 Tax=Collybia nuda TaxID=64659 RepID=A0A9P5XYD3_9AGAR|nr:hypothetical protein BDZ94DRAFT_1170722 [Collybia nuda]
MPKSNPTPSPKTHHKLGSDDSTSRMTDIAVRKKKNADAQAAFRARRANYIATLEETVTSLESVVLQLQDSCREARNETQELKHENSRIRHEFREREKFWRALWQTKKSQGHGLDEDLPPLPAFFTSAHGQNGHIGSLPLHGYGNSPYRMNDAPSVCGTAYNVNQSHYHSQSPSMAYTGVEADISGDSSQSSNHRGGKYGPYPYSIHGVSREAPWPSTLGTNGSSGGDSGAPHSNHSSHSPGFVGSPTLVSSEIPYINRFPMEDQKASLSTLDTAPYVFPTSRSLSPTTSTPNSSSSTSLTSFQFTFPEASSNDRPEFDYRRHPHSHGAEVTLHGGTADISLMGPGSDAVRFRLGTRRVECGDRPALPALPTQSGSDNGSQHERGSSDGDSTPYSHPRLRARRSAGPTAILSRSPSPGAPTLSGTLAVIKAQAFGALRRTRTRTKKADGAAMVAKDVLEARGIGMETSAGSKRQRLQDDDEDDTSPS